MEFTSFDDLKNLLGSEGLDGKPSIMKRNIIGSSIKVPKKEQIHPTAGSRHSAQLVIHKDTEKLQ